MTEIIYRLATWSCTQETYLCTGFLAKIDAMSDCTIKIDLIHAKTSASTMIRAEHTSINALNLYDVAHVRANTILSHNTRAEYIQ